MRLLGTFAATRTLTTPCKKGHHAAVSVQSTCCAYIYRRLGGVIGVSRPLTGKSFRFVRACDAKLCVSARRMRFRLLGLHTDLQRRARRGGVPRPFVVFWFKKCTTLARNRHFWSKTVKNVRASRFFIFRTVKNVRACRVFIL